VGRATNSMSRFRSGTLLPAGIPRFPPYPHTRPLPSFAVAALGERGVATLVGGSHGGGLEVILWASHFERVPQGDFGEILRGVFAGSLEGDFERVPQGDFVEILRGDFAGSLEGDFERVPWGEFEGDQWGDFEGSPEKVV
jgi:hypothetical protein